MQHTVSGFQHIELTREINYVEGVRFDPETITLGGLYRDELSAHRAKKVWTETFESYFLLDTGHDFGLRIVGNMQEGKYLLVCEFLTACARYAFWRLTNNQAIEAQYLIETAHIPNCRSREEDLIEASDLKCLRRSKEMTKDNNFQESTGESSIFSSIKGFLTKLRNTHSRPNLS